MPTLHVDVAKHPTHVLVRVSGEGSLDQVQTLQAALHELVGERPAVVLIELSQLQFAASLFMGTLVHFRGELKRSGGSVRLIGLQGRVRESFERANLLYLFPAFDSVEAALAV